VLAREAIQLKIENGKLKMSERRENNGKLKMENWKLKVQSSKWMTEEVTLSPRSRRSVTLHIIPTIKHIALFIHIMWRVERCRNRLLYEAMKLGKLNIDPLLMCVIKTGRKLRPSKESLIGFVLRARQLKEQGGNSVENGKLKVENDPDIG